MTNKPLDRIIALLKDPTEVWVFDGYTAEHTKTGLEIWTANGFLFCDTYPVGMRLGLWAKWRLYQAAKVARRNHVVQLFWKGDQ